LQTLQHSDGHWCGELQGDTILESEYVLLQAFLGRFGDPRMGKCGRYILSLQGSDGGWSNYPGGPADVSVSTKAYFALKLAGHDPESEPMRRARFTILELGGAETVNSFTRYYLAALGQIPYGQCPSVPPELLLMPRWCPVNLYAMSAWTRTIVVPLSIVHAHRPVTQIPPAMGISELFRTAPTAGQISAAARFEGRMLTWPNAFRLIDRALKLYERLPLRFLRRRALRAAEAWMLERFEGSDGLGAIFPPMVYTIMALKCLGYGPDSAELTWAEQKLDELIIEEHDTIRLQPCFSPIWDTALVMIGLADAGLPSSHRSLEKAAEWLLDREIRDPGDWCVNNSDAQPSGWAFEYHNKFYPDLDDTAMVLMALKRTRAFLDERCQQAVHRALCFVLTMQNRDGGWGAFDRNVANSLLEAIPFADHNAMLDPSCPDITARILEMLGQLGFRRGKPFIDNAIRFLFDHQEPEGCWYGRWGVNYVYGTWQVLSGLASIGYDMRHPKVQKAVSWLKSVQQPCGGWGESCASYRDRATMGRGPVTPSQTAWAILGLVAAGLAQCQSVAQGIAHLINTQNRDGSWDEPWFTGTGFPKVFYLRYHYYRLYFPLLALSRYRSAVFSTGESSEPAKPVPSPTAL
jgi:squalene-hopene/tetraprenyl-beta-curcumene cyclase